MLKSEYPLHRLPLPKPGTSRRSVLSVYSVYSLNRSAVCATFAVLCASIRSAGTPSAPRRYNNDQAQQ